MRGTGGSGGERCDSVLSWVAASGRDPQGNQPQPSQRATEEATESWMVQAICIANAADANHLEILGEGLESWLSGGNAQHSGS